MTIHREMPVKLKSLTPLEVCEACVLGMRDGYMVHLSIKRRTRLALRHLGHAMRVVDGLVVTDGLIVSQAYRNQVVYIHVTFQDTLTVFRIYTDEWSESTYSYLNAKRAFYAKYGQFHGLALHILEYPELAQVLLANSGLPHKSDKIPVYISDVPGLSDLDIEALEGWADEEASELSTSDVDALIRWAGPTV